MLQMRLLSSFLALALSASTAMAADVVPLSPGAPAGVKPAQDFMQDSTLLYVAIGAAVIAGIAVAASSGGNAAPAAAAAGGTTTTTTTTTTTA
jgi:hypothetical protein